MTADDIKPLVDKLAEQATALESCRNAVQRFYDSVHRLKCDCPGAQRGTVHMHQDECPIGILMNCQALNRRG